MPAGFVPLGMVDQFCGTLFLRQSRFGVVDPICRMWPGLTVGGNLQEGLVVAAERAQCLRLPTPIWVEPVQLLEPVTRRQELAWLTSLWYGATWPRTDT